VPDAWVSVEHILQRSRHCRTVTHIGCPSWRKFLNIALKSLPILADRKGAPMKLYDGGRAPNPRRVRIFLAEKGIEIERQQVDLGTLEHKGAAYTAINPLQQVPALELDDGTILTESIAICRYFEALQPEPALFGRNGREAAIIEMWNRRIEQRLLFGVAQVFRHLHPAMKPMENPQITAWGEVNKPRVMQFLNLLDSELASRAYVSSDAFSVADISGLVAIDLMKPAKLAVPDEMKHVKRWYTDITARPSAAA
jgi:glutathione S-transferase